MLRTRAPARTPRFIAPPSEARTCKSDPSNRITDCRSPEEIRPRMVHPIHFDFCQPCRTTGSTCRVNSIPSGSHAIPFAISFRTCFASPITVSFRDWSSTHRITPSSESPASSSVCPWTTRRCPPDWTQSHTQRHELTLAARFLQLMSTLVLSVTVDTNGSQHNWK